MPGAAGVYAPAAMAEPAGAGSVVSDGSTPISKGARDPSTLPGPLGQVLRWIEDLPFGLTFGLLVLAVAAGQFVEDLIDSPPLQMLPPAIVVPRWALIAATAYMLLVFKLIDRPVQRSLGLVQHVVRIDPAEFRAYWSRMLTADHRVELVLFGISAAIVVTLYPILGRTLPTTVDPVTSRGIPLPSNPVEALVVLVAYTLLGWAGLRLIYRITRVARALGQLSRQPLVIDVYDISDLLPFGRIALMLSLAPVGLMILLLVGLGSPQGAIAWLVLSLATTASLLALVLPLRGIHRQMGAAKQTVTAELNRELRGAHRDLTSAAPLSNDEMTQVANWTAALINLRKVVGEMPTWPFQDTVAFGPRHADRERPGDLRGHQRPDRRALRAAHRFLTRRACAAAAAATDRRGSASRAERDGRGPAVGPGLGARPDVVRRVAVLTRAQPSFPGRHRIRRQSRIRFLASTVFVVNVGSAS